LPDAEERAVFLYTKGENRFGDRENAGGRKKRKPSGLEKNHGDQSLSGTTGGVLCCTEWGLAFFTWGKKSGLRHHGRKNQGGERETAKRGNASQRSSGGSKKSSHDHFSGTTPMIPGEGRLHSGKINQAETQGERRCRGTRRREEYVRDWYENSTQPRGREVVVAKGSKRTSGVKEPRMANATSGKGPER